jgi:3-hydroxybenzoate 6-monooxygenase
MATVLVAGGGVGGLAAAVSVARQGHRVLVLERCAEFAELGAGIQLAPNAFHALDRLGVGERVRSTAVYIDELRFMDGTTGEQVAAMPLDHGYRFRFGNPYAVVQRGDLYQPLLAACAKHPAIELAPNSHVLRYEQDGDVVAAVLADGRRHTGDLLIGADGIRSAVRGQLVGDGPPRVSGHTIYRCVIPMALVPKRLRSNTVTLWAGPRWHFVHYPIGSGRFLNLAATRDDDARQVMVGEPADAAHVHRQFVDMCDTARELLGLGGDWRTWVLCDRDPVPGWTDGRVVLLGDAAHPMLQYAAQGACMALEDAVLLGDLLDAPAAAFPEQVVRWNDARAARTARAQFVSREMGTRLYHPAGQDAVARNAMLAAMSVTDLHDAVAWLHGTTEETELPLKRSISWLPTAPQGNVTQASHKHVAKQHHSSTNVTRTLNSGEAGQSLS